MVYLPECKIVHFFKANKLTEKVYMVHPGKQN
jgi:hypothetical protein